MAGLIMQAWDRKDQQPKAIKHLVTNVPNQDRVDVCIYGMTHEDADQLALMLAILPRFKAVSADLFAANAIADVEDRRAS